MALGWFGIAQENHEKKTIAQKKFWGTILGVPVFGVS
jgi:hypothetical protein